MSTIEMMQVQQGQIMLDTIFSDIDGFMLSQDTKNEHRYAGYTYDECNNEAFLSIVEKVQIQRHETFLDIGCGVGKKLCAVALFSSCEQIIGIEIHPKLYEGARKAVEKLPLEKRTHVQAYLQDYLLYDMSFADVVFISLEPTILTIHLQTIFPEKFLSLKKGARIITTDIPIALEGFALLAEEPCQFRAGEGMMYLYRKEF